jgi:hypothetical protein
MNKEPKLVERVIGLDAHPDSFTAAVIRGPSPAVAVVEKTFNKVPLGQLQSWAQKHTTAQDLIVLEASGNSFQVVRTLAAIDRRALVLESCHLGKLKEAHANNDKISAVRIGKAYLAGTAKEVWVPDAKTQERRDWFHGYRKATKRTTQMQARVRSYLSDNGVRLQPQVDLIPVGEVEAQIRQARPWSPRQWQVLELLLLDLRHADQQRQHWRVSWLRLSSCGLGHQRFTTSARHSPIICTPLLKMPSSMTSGGRNFRTWSSAPASSRITRRRKASREMALARSGRAISTPWIRPRPRTFRIC